MKDREKEREKIEKLFASNACQLFFDMIYDIRPKYILE